MPQTLLHPQGRKRRGGAAPKAGKEGEKQLLYSSVTLVDLPGSVRQPSDNEVRKKEDVAVTKMLANLSNW